MTKTSAGEYAPIGDYGFLSDCHSAALVSRSGSIDWCCMPRTDSGAVFARLLDASAGGHFQIAPADAAFGSSRRYLDDTLVLETTFEASGGKVRVLDCFTMAEGGASTPQRQLLRVVEGVQGTVECRAHLAARFDYAGIRPWLRRHGERLFSAIGGNDALVICTDADLEPVSEHDLAADLVVAAGTRYRFSLTWTPPERIDPSPPEQPSPGELDGRLDETVDWWRRWAAKVSGAPNPAARRSAIVLKGLTNAPTGAVAAAPTTSLPEAVGGERNWDYRASWIRDSVCLERKVMTM